MLVRPPGDENSEDPEHLLFRDERLVSGNEVNDVTDIMRRRATRRLKVRMGK